MLPGAPTDGLFIVTPSVGNPREGTFRFESTTPLKWLFTFGTYVLEREFLVLFASPESASAKADLLLFQHPIVGAQGKEILAHVYVVDPTRRHVPLFVFP